jgi:hypothetical protein
MGSRSDSVDQTSVLVTVTEQEKLDRGRRMHLVEWISECMLWVEPDSEVVGLRLKDRGERALRAWEMILDCPDEE